MPLVRHFPHVSGPKPTSPSTRRTRIRRTILVSAAVIAIFVVFFTGSDENDERHGDEPSLRTSAVRAGTTTTQESTQKIPATGMQFDPQTAPRDEVSSTQEQDQAGQSMSSLESSSTTSKSTEAKSASAVAAEKGDAGGVAGATGGEETMVYDHASLPLLGHPDTIKGTDLVWELPGHADPEGIAFFAHACARKATHFWPKSASCPSCSGLPEEMALVQEAIARRYAVVAVSSVDTCWDMTWPVDANKEAKRVAEVLQAWKEARALLALPWVALGASGGGNFVSLLSHLMSFEAAVMVVSIGEPKAFENPTPSGKPFPPTLFVHMPKDKDTFSGVTQVFNLLKGKGLKTAQIQCLELEVTATFLSERIPSFSEAHSAAVFNALKSRFIIDEGGHLKFHPRHSRLRDAFQKDSIHVLVDESLMDSVEQELNLAYGKHETTSLYRMQMWDWMEGVCTGVKTENGEKRSDVVRERCDYYVRV